MQCPPNLQSSTCSDFLLRVFLYLLGHSSERERQANIEKNRALLQELKLDDGPAALGFVPVQPTKGKGKASGRDGAKPVQPKKVAGKKRKSRGGGGGKDGEDDDDDSGEEVITRRMPTRRGRKSTVDPSETPEQRAAREVCPHLR